MAAHLSCLGLMSLSRPGLVSLLYLSHPFPLTYSPCASPLHPIWAQHTTLFGFYLLLYPSLSVMYLLIVHAQTVEIEGSCSLS